MLTDIAVSTCVEEGGAPEDSKTTQAAAGGVVQDKAAAAGADEQQQQLSTVELTADVGNWDWWSSSLVPEPPPTTGPPSITDCAAGPHADSLSIPVRSAPSPPTLPTCLPRPCALPSPDSGAHHFPL